MDIADEREEEEEEEELKTTGDEEKRLKRTRRDLEEEAGDDEMGPPKPRGFSSIQDLDESSIPPTGASASSSSGSLQSDKDEKDKKDFVPPKPKKPTPKRQKKVKPVKKKKNPKTSLMPKSYYRLHASRLPASEMYEKSYQHRAVVTHLAVTKTDFLITCSKDGIVKFWKKQPLGIEFVKQFRAHKEEINDISVSVDGFLLATISADKGIKIFSVPDFDMIHMIRLKYEPFVCEWIHAPQSAKGTLAVARKGTNDIYIYQSGGSNEPIKTLTIHSNPVTLIRYNDKYKCVISTDSKGMLEYWSTDTFERPENVTWKFKTDTDLYEFLKTKTVPASLTFSRDWELFAVMGEDQYIRIFHFSTGKLKKKLMKL